MANETKGYLPYKEPGVITILVLSSFLILLNILNHVLNRLIHCGLVGQILLGIAWGTPGGNWIKKSSQETIMMLGYIGLILMVYEGGLATPFRTMRDNLLLSLLIALTGILIPIALSFTLLTYSNASPVAAFSAGAALCSTSLGTALTVLSSSSLRSTKLGVLLTNAAVLDDIAGLIMMQVVHNLGDGNFSAASVLRPVFVSLGLIVVVALFCYFLLLPLSVRIEDFFHRHNDVNGYFSPDRVLFVIHTFILVGLVTGAIYAGASGLTAAYVTGAAITWWDEEISRLRQFRRKTADNQEGGSDYLSPYQSQGSYSISVSSNRDIGNYVKYSGMQIYNKFYMQALDRILRPFFFGSIGFSIPIVQMFSGRLIWRGFVYAVLMFIAKVLCGLWVFFVSYLFHRKKSEKPKDYSISSGLYSSALLGMSMVPRGEIGFLVSSMAESKGVFGPPGDNGTSSDVYIIVTWAIVICTIFGPIFIGSIIRHLRSKNKDIRSQLGEWGTR
ncbi:Piso0_003687 [Millerozyma farinosa CBS 7064]|uniref:Piso0_003687 protein n=1 Tax=Pichia sorbitophila (strain ATCC MYA-4447 / BCRC 22081 / CBS 7064 / NBRC 10061 / NRRL Y-12695) TaxID=559304 RepID=G8YAR1_PICSO|nr:Piso0_003687 [Millerozyma farinosa CBS 7064]CCE84146.1 Piso0_003687 [Millerozyma farinosa CBS 7064]